ncbi:hypothetical protein SUSAZ_00755 [Sulfolobus acidocaldarius SUSAZ]|nr:hypothetical protein SUSAZ_00755 [Sulfolobus acidocaldarius SUSAZ]
MEKTGFENLTKKLDEISEAGLSFNEAELIRFLRSEVKKQKSLLDSFNEALDSQRWEEALSSFLLFTQRVNVVFIYLFQPTHISLLTGSKISSLLEEYLSATSLSISMSLLKLRPHLKKIGVESITTSILSNPPSLNFSMVIKGE